MKNDSQGALRSWFYALVLIMFSVAVSPQATAADHAMVREAGTLDAGEYNTCAIMNAGNVYCWGWNNASQNYPEANLKFVSVSAGYDHTCGVLADGKIKCWGSSASIGTIPATGTYLSVAAGHAATCAVRTDGALVCWGGELAGAAPVGGQFLKVTVTRDRGCGIRGDGTLDCWQTAGVPGFGLTPSGEFVDIAIGAGHACALGVDGTVTCWGSNTHGQLTAPVDVRFVAITVGLQHTCGIAEDASIRCWGASPSGQSTAPSGRFTAISAGRLHVCARQINGSLQCWGGDSLNGELGAMPGAWFQKVDVGGGEACAIDTGSDPVCTGPAQVLTPSARRYVMLSIGETNACGLLQDGRATCWGASLSQTTEPMESLSVGENHACGVGFDNKPVCWGDNTFGQLDAPQLLFRQIVSGDRFSCGMTYVDGRLACWGQGATVTQMPAGTGFRHLSAHAGNVCAINAEYRPVCWGDDAALAAVPAQQMGKVAVGARHACGIAGYGSLVCWGDNAHGQLNAPAPDQFTSLDASANTTCAITNLRMKCWGEHAHDIPAFNSRIGNEMLAVGRAHSCGLRRNGTASCWGDGSDGQRQVPAAPLALIEAYADQSCAIDGDNRVQCWGGGEGQNPVPMPDRVRDIAIGERNGCAVRVDGTLACWGWNGNDQSTPPPGRFRAVSTALNHSCAVGADARVSCWGYNADGQSTPPSRTFRSVDNGERHSCGIATDGTMHCWGLGSEGQTIPPDIDGVTYSALAVGAFHNCAITGAGSVVCWGRNTEGQSTPPIEGRFFAISAGDTHTCAISDSGIRVCWGGNAVGQAPVPALGPYPLPPAVLGQPYRVDLAMLAEGGYMPTGPKFQHDLGNLPWGIRFTPYGQLVGTASGSPGTHVFSASAIDEKGFRATRTFQLQVVRPPDTTPPFIQPRINGDLTLREWYNSDVRLEWHVTDDGSDVTSLSGCGTITIGQDTTGIDVTCTATSGGGTISRTVTIRRDTSPPDTVLLQRPPAVGYGNIYASATFTFESPGDPLSGLDGFECGTNGEIWISCTSPYVYRDMVWDRPYVFLIRARDRAGNVDPTPVRHEWIHRRDTTPPQLNNTVTGLLGDNDWYRSDIAVRWSVVDPETAVTSMAGCQSLDVTSDTYEVYASCIARSLGGESTSFIRLRRDATPPTITASMATAPNAAGWHRANVYVNYQCGDGMSGLAQPCPSSDILSEEGRGISTTAKSIRDSAGNTVTSGIVTINLDKTPPTMTSAPDRSPNAAGWYRDAVRVDYACSDALSGLAGPCPPSRTVTSEGRNMLVSESVADLADNWGGASRYINLDRTPPSVSASASPAANANGWHRSDVSVSHYCSDNLSGLAGSCPQIQVFSQETASATSNSHVVFDLAGNASAPSTGVTVRIDKTAPTLSVIMPPAQVYLNASHDFALNVTDGLSGVATQGCTGFSTSTLGTRTVTCTATDRAGNTTTRSSTYRVVYDFVALSAPLSSPTTTYLVQAPRSVPFEWRVRDANGQQVSNATLTQATVTEVACQDTGVALPTPPAGETTTFENFGDGRYRRNWWINYGGSIVCLRLDVTLNDGITRSGLVRVVPKLRPTGGPLRPEQRPVPEQRPIQGRPVPGALRPAQSRPRAR